MTPVGTSITHNQHILLCGSLIQREVILEILSFSLNIAVNLVFLFLKQSGFFFGLVGLVGWFVCLFVFRK